MTSPSVEPLLVSNDAPQPTQTILVRAILQDKEARLLALGAEITELQVALQTLQSKYAGLAAEIIQYKSTLSPVRRIPPEIIAEIFLYFLPSLVWDEKFPKLQPSKLPWKLGHICRLWRTVALSLGQLWSVVDLVFTGGTRDWGMPRLVRPDENSEERELTQLPPNPCRHYHYTGYGTYHCDWLDCEYKQAHWIQTDLDLIDGSVQRSGDHTISLRLQPPYFAVHPVMDAVLKHSARWGEIALVRPGRSLLQRLTDFEGHFEQLRKITLASAFDQRFPYQSAPNLTNLSLVLVQIPPGSRLQIPWSQLTRYREEDCGWLDPVERLASYRQLTNLLVFRLKWAAQRFQTPAEALLFPSLRVASLQLSMRLGEKLVPLLDMPVLQSFSIEIEGDACQLHLCLPHSSPHLKVLRVTMLTCIGDAERAFEMFPDLTEIALDSPYIISDNILSRLIPYPDRPPLSPKLELIRFSNRSFLHNDCKWETLVELLRARFRPTIDGIASLHTFEFPTGLGVRDEVVISSLKRLRKKEHWNIKVDEECRHLNWENMYL
ncbi:hypothetical protein DFH07DRAFT_876837 [Mycena maculata]|uniref:F-box domain-containing protein n=1 Tax=Mycena maculata TaxID=230809 RepID=A0AAD7K5L9_9AGAR|nr:hypothetical protein DFH07DRAFT_876837 [Mycena maculata]